jgi:SPP1 gp7 family putative phage head morphogenesis protein
LESVKNLPLNEPFLSSLSRHLIESMETADAIARSLILRKDEALSQRASASPVHAMIDASEWLTLAQSAVRVSFDLTPKEALDYIRYKSLTIAGVESGQIRLDVQRKLEQALKDGLSLDEFKQQVDSIFDSYGVTRLQPLHLETVFRTNLFTAYSVGELDQVTSMADRFPMWRYSAILDDRTRPTHRALNGNIYRVGEGPVPPIDYNCRCTAIYLHISQTEGLAPLDWQPNEQVQRFDTRASFENWKEANSDLLTPDVQSWIDSHLGQSGSKVE